MSKEILETNIDEKLTVLLHSNYAGMKSGFGGYIREMMTYLHKTGKYNLVLYAAAVPWENKDFERWPWKTYGALPITQAEINLINREPEMQRAANYGAFNIDKVIQTVKPDVYVGIEDPWGIDFCRGKPWWGKIPCVVHTTLDSRPILQQAIDLAKSTPYFYSWADFATKEIVKIQGCEHAKTMRGTVNTHVFRRLGDAHRLELRRRFGIPDDAFCIGMLSRNQLRKSFPNVIRAFKDFKDRNPQIKMPRLLLFTHFSEGWNIPKICNEIGVPPSDLLCTYKCRATGRYYVAPFQGQDLNNPETGNEKSLVTVNIKDGLMEEQVNEWYNLLDVYVHAFTSGGQERSIQEAKLTELITLVTNYSCGEDNCVPEAESLPLDWEEYREPNEAQFIKATTKPYSIVKQLEKVYRMAPQKKREMGRQAREWVLKNFAIEVLGKQMEELLDSFKPTKYNFEFKPEEKNPNAVIPDISDDAEWLIRMYKDILNLDIHEQDNGLKEWLQKMKNGAPRQGVESCFREVARGDIARNEEQDLNKSLGSEPPEERVLITMPQSLGDCLYITSLLEDARNLYPDKKIYVATNPDFMEVFYPLVGRYIDYVIPFKAPYENVYAMEGYGGATKYFEIVLCPHFRTQRNADYIHNGADKTTFLK